MSERAEYVIDLKDLFSSKLKNADRALDNFESKLKGATGSGGAISQFSVGLKTLFAGALVTAIGAAVRQASNLAGAAEQTRISYEVMVGDIEKGNKLLRDIKKYADYTPYGFAELSDAGKKLLNFNVDLKDVMPTIKMLGDVASGDKNKLESLALVYGQVNAAGRLMGQDLLQLINVGFNPLQVISEKTGVSMKDLKKKMEDGAISAKDVARAFKIATSEGGLFHDMTERQAETFEGRWSTSVDKLKTALTGAGNLFNQVLSPLLQMLNDTLDKAQNANQYAVDNYVKDVRDKGELLNLYQSLAEYQKVKTPYGKRAFEDTQKELLEKFPQFAKGFEGGVPKGVDVQRLQRYLKLTTGNRDVVLKGIDAEIEQKQKVIQVLNEALETQVSKGLYDTKDARGASQAIRQYTKDLDDLLKMRAAFANPSKTPPKGFLASGLPDNSKFDFETASTKKKKKNGVDGDVRSGGIKNIVINITQLVGEINFEQFDKMSENKVVEIVKRALLTAVNDANSAIE